jgi:poly-gamma-glutamate synthase PgsB/CapB
MMSIHPECSFVESVQMFKPHVLVITNVRLDHLEQMGRSKEEIARCFACSIPENAAVFIDAEYFPLFDEAAKKRNSKVIKVDREFFKEKFEPQKEFSPFEFEENIRLALAVAEFLGVEREAALRGIKKAIPDFGSLKVWTRDFGSPPRRFFLVSAFAANDPESTRAVLTNIREKISFEKKNIIALLNLRKDRGDRTAQWMEALNAGVFPEFQKIFLNGDHGYVLKRKLKKTLKAELFILKNKVPQRIMEEISEKAEADEVLFGIGNMGGIGKELVKYWEGLGQSHDF